MRFSSDVSRWLQSAEKKILSFNMVERQYGTTSLMLRASDMEVVRWVERFLTPMLDRHAVPIEDKAPPPSLSISIIFMTMLSFRR